MSPRTSQRWHDDSIPSLREPRYSQSLERGLAILGCFTPARPVLGIADIADDLGMIRSTTHRYVATLVALGYLEQDSSRKYRLAMRVTDLGMSALAATGLRDHAHSALKQLSQRAAGTVSLGVLDGTDVIYMDQAHSFRRRGRTQTARPGTRIPAYCSAMGKVLLASLDKQEQDASIAAMRFEKFGPNTISSKRALREEMQAVLDANVALDDEEQAEDVYSIAAPIRDEAHEVLAAIEIAVPSGTISLAQLEAALGPHLLSTAEQISARLGYRRADQVRR